MKKVLSISLVLVLLFTVFSCSDEPISLGELTGINSSYIVGDELKIPTETTANVPVTYTVTYTDANGKASVINVADNKIVLERGTYKIEFKAANGLEINKEIKVTEEAFDSVFNGFGTEARPYEIADAKEFMKLNGMEVGSANKKYFKLTGDIDLRTISPENNYAVRAFDGILDGANHIITGNNNIPFIFYYLFADSAISNLKIDFDSNSITRIWCATSIKGNYNAETKNVSYDKDRIDLTFKNVDFVPSLTASYFIGDNNAGLYQDNTTSYGAVLSDNEYIRYFISEVAKYTITLTDCDAFGNYNGGFGASGAAIFFGGQLWRVDLVLDNCSFNGKLEGYNVGMLIGNGVNCDGSNITLTNVRNDGEIYSYTNSGSLLYGNRKESKAVVNGKITETGKIIQVSPSLELNSPNRNCAFDFSFFGGNYELKLFLPSVYSYSGDEFKYQTNSNTITVPVTKDTKDFYLAKVISADDPKAKGLNLTEWKNVNTSTNEGFKYQFAKDGTDWYMVISYGTDMNTFYTKNDEGLDVEPTYMKNAILLEYNTEGAIENASKLVSLSTN